MQKQVDGVIEPLPVQVNRWRHVKTAFKGTADMFLTISGVFTEEIQPLAAVFTSLPQGKGGSQPLGDGLVDMIGM